MTDSPSRAAGPNYKWWVLPVVQCSFLLVGVDSTIVNLALPTIAGEMDASLGTAQWTIAAYFITTAVTLPMAGRLADLFGLKKVFLAGFGVFTLSSLGCGVAPDIQTLIAMRIVQAVGAACLLANSNVISLGVFPVEQHALAIGINGAVFSLGFALGYTLGGFLIEWFGWRSIFLVNLPFGLLAMGLGVTILMERRIRKVKPERVPFDFAGATLSVVALAIIMLSLDRFAQQGGFSPLPTAGFVIGLVGLFAFVRVELLTKHPLIDVRLFRNRLFNVGLLTRSLSNCVFAASAFVVPFYTQAILGFSPLESGLMMLPFALAFAVAGPLSGRAVGKVGSRTLTVTGYVTTTLAMFVLGLLGVGDGDPHPEILKVALGMGLLGLGGGFFISPNSGVTLDSVPPEKSGAASGLLYCMAFIGSAIGTAYAASVLANGLRNDGGMAALRDHAANASAIAAFVQAQGFVFHSLLVASLAGVFLCATRGSKLGG